MPGRLMTKTRFRIRAIYEGGRTELSNEIELSPNQETQISTRITSSQLGEYSLVSSGLLPGAATSIELLDVTGRHVISQQIYSETGILSYKINASGYPAGWYIAKVSQLGRVSTVRFLIRN